MKGSAVGEWNGGTRGRNSGVCGFRIFLFRSVHAIDYWVWTGLWNSFGLNQLHVHVIMSQPEIEYAWEPFFFQIKFVVF